MKKPFKIRPYRSKSGLPPGTLIHTGEKKTDKAKISVIDYTAESLFQQTVENIESSKQYIDSENISWINIDGLHEVDMLRSAGQIFGLHPLVLEDILSTNQRPKLEVYGDYIYIVCRMLLYDEQKMLLTNEQFSMVLGKNYVLTFQEKPGDVLNPVRHRLENESGRLRNNGSDYLAYAILDAIVDHYFVILEQVGEFIINIEKDLMNDPGEEIIDEIHDMKREMISLRSAIWPLRDVISQLNRGEFKFFTDKTLIFLRDLYDHTIQVVDTVESYRDMLSGLMDLYLSTLSNRMNEVMKVLTIIATIFIPLTFIAGVYGMNFEYMPELELPWAYPAVWVIMITMVIIMLIYFRKKKWL